MYSSLITYPSFVGANAKLCSTADLVLDILENAPEYHPPSSPGISICAISVTLCQFGDYDAFLLSVSLWATLQLTWTSILAVSHLWQVSKQMTTFEVSNLGRYGFMGGRGGQSLRDQSGAMKQASAVGAGVGPMAASEDAVGVEASFGPDGTAFATIQGGKHNHGHGHSHQTLGLPRVCGVVGRLVGGPLFQILGLDRFTRGEALGGMRRAGMDQNPFDMGVVKVEVKLRLVGKHANYTTDRIVRIFGWAQKWIIRVCMKFHLKVCLLTFSGSEH